MGVRPFYKRFKHDGARGPNMATVYSDRGHGVRAPVVFYNRSNEAAALLKPGDFDWKAIFARRRALVPQRRHLRRALRDDRRADHRGHAGGEEQRRDRVVRSELPRKALERVRRRARAGARRDVAHRQARRCARRQRGGSAEGAGDTRTRGRGQVGAGLRRLSRYDRQRRRPPSADQGPRHHAARGPLHEPPHVERGRVDRRQGVRRSDLRARRARSRRRRRRLCVGPLLRPHERRGAGRGAEARMGARRAGHHVPGRHDDGQGRSRCGRSPKAARREFNGSEESESRVRVS